MTFTVPPAFRLGMSGVNRPSRNSWTPLDVPTQRVPSRSSCQTRYCPGGEAILHRVVGERAGLKPAQATRPHADPDRSGAILVDRVDVAIEQSFRLRVGNDDLFVYATESLLAGAQPEIPLAVLAERPEDDGFGAAGSAKGQGPAQRLIDTQRPTRAVSIAPGGLPSDTRGQCLDGPEAPRRARRRHRSRQGGVRPCLPNTTARSFDPAPARRIPAGRRATPEEPGAPTGRSRRAAAPRVFVPQTPPVSVQSRARTCLGLPARQSRRIALRPVATA